MAGRQLTLPASAAPHLTKVTSGCHRAPFARRLVPLACPGSDAVRNGRGSVALRLPEGDLDGVAVGLDCRVQPDADGRRVRRRLVRSR